MGFAERRAEGIWARRLGRQSIQRAGCLLLPVTIWRVLVIGRPAFVWLVETRQGTNLRERRFRITRSLYLGVVAASETGSS